MKKKRVLTVGCGYVGSVLARHLAEKIGSVEVVVSDGNKRAIEKIVGEINRDNVSSLTLDFSDFDLLVNTMRDFDLTIGLAPGRLGFQTVKASIEAGADMVDLSYMSEDPLQLNDKAKGHEVTVIPDCGVAPGLSNILVGRAASLLDKVTEVKILVGGFPQERIPPLDYKVTWCVEDLIEEYVRKAKIVENGKTIEVEALEGVEVIDFPGLGEVEAFYTDGVRTLHHTIKGVQSMWEKTMRYPGHRDNIILLRDLGFFNEDPIVKGVSPLEMSIKLLESKLRLPEVKDLVAMNIDVCGEKKGAKTCLNYYMMDYFDEKNRITSMGRTTAYTASIVVQMLAEGEIREKGVIPPEKLGMNEELYTKMISRLQEEKIIIETKIS